MPEKSEYLYKIQLNRLELLTNGSTLREEKILDEHFDYLKDLTDKGIVILAGRTLNTDSSSFGIVIFRADSDEAAHAIMENDPAVKNRLCVQNFIHIK